MGAEKSEIHAGALWVDPGVSLIKSYDCTFIESLYMYQPYLTYSNKNSVPPVMTKWSIIGYREEINCSSLHSGNIVAKSWDKISFKFWPLIMHFEQVYPPPSPLSPFPNPYTFPPNWLKTIIPTYLIFPSISITQPIQIHSTLCFCFNLKMLWLHSLHLLFLNLIILDLLIFPL